MDMFEEAEAIVATLGLCKITEAELGRRMGVSQSYVANKRRLLSFSPKMREKIRASGITERHARSLLRLDGEEGQLRILEKVVSGGLTVRECEALVDIEAVRAVPKAISRAENLTRVDTFVDSLRKSLDTLCSFGVDAKSRTSYYGNKMYITVCIDEG